MSKSSGLVGTKSLMGALVRMKPKPHEKLVGKAKAKKAKSPKRKKKAT